MNVVMIKGKVKKIITERKTKFGKMVVFSLQFNFGKDKYGFVNVIANNVNLTEGETICIYGKLTENVYEKEGKKIRQIQLNANDITKY